MSEMGPSGGGGAFDISSISGYKDGFVIKYNSATDVAVTAGNVEANGKAYTLSADTTKSITGLAAPFAKIYIYIDDDASSPPIATLINSTTVPVWSPTKRGWYNGDDRCISAIWSQDGSAVIEYFDTEVISNRNIAYTYSASTGIALAAAMNPTSAWQTPNINQASVAMPVNAVAIRLLMQGSRLGGIAEVNAASSEYAAAHASFLSNGNLHTRGEEIREATTIPLGASRNIQIGGLNADDNALYAFCPGYVIEV
jgi:hypothetical protein